MNCAAMYDLATLLRIETASNYLDIFEVLRHQRMANKVLSIST
jgi:hypothetical protein